ncbi:MAG: putative hydrolase of the HAD superfamily [Planctomycetota bacterium]|jgi:putative hydrolase of the HAD superfamily
MAAKLTLLFDADDTLWLNATLFETALQEWQHLLTESGVENEAAYSLFKELEERGFRRGWYGARRLEINMNAAARMLLPKNVAKTLIAPIANIVDRVRKPEMLLFDGVHETLQYLGTHHQLLLVTMGEKDEQLVKINGSGLGHYFSSIHVLPDKTRQQYAHIIQEHRLNRRDSWMIGNSLSKDIRPARAAGLKTCHIDNGHDFNFGLTVDSIEADIVIDEFHRLGEIFSVES